MKGPQIDSPCRAVSCLGLGFNVLLKLTRERQTFACCEPRFGVQVGILTSYELCKFRPANRDEPSHFSCADLCSGCDSALQLQQFSFSAAARISNAIASGTSIQRHVRSASSPTQAQRYVFFRGLEQTECRRARDWRRKRGEDTRRGATDWPVGQTVWKQCLQPVGEASFIQPCTCSTGHPHEERDCSAVLDAENCSAQQEEAAPETAGPEAEAGASEEHVPSLRIRACGHLARAGANQMAFDTDLMALRIVSEGAIDIVGPLPKKTPTFFLVFSKFLKPDIVS